MAAIALQPFHVTTPRSVETKLPSSLAQDLDLYRRLYKDAYGADVSEGDLVREIIRAFLERDEEFRRFKLNAAPTNARRRSRRNAGDAGARGENGSALHSAAEPAGRR